jgi:hypothetical protein
MRHWFDVQTTDCVATISVLSSEIEAIDYINRTLYLKSGNKLSISLETANAIGNALRETEEHWDVFEE